MKLLALVFALSCATQATAAGSFRPEIELAPLLEGAPAVRDFVANTLELAPSGSAGRIGSLVNPRFGGRRVGPYRILAKPKGSEGPFVFELSFHTELVFLDARNRSAELPDAQRIRERFESLELRPIDAE